jgi:hypothetical protein
MDIQLATRDYALCLSNNTITEPNGGTWVSAAALYLGATEPVNGSWIQALCAQLGISQPLYGSWVIALADHYGITQPENGTWWWAIANTVCNGGAPQVPCIWGVNTNTFGIETRTFGSTAPCAIIPVVDLVWNTTDTDWNLEDEEWAIDFNPPAPPVWSSFTTTNNLQPLVNGTAEAFSTISFVIDAQTYTTLTDSLGNWQIQITNDLVGAAAPGTDYLGSCTATDPAGNTSSAGTATITSIVTTVTYNFKLQDTYGDGWNRGYCKVQKESSPGSGVWTDVNFNGNPYAYDNSADMTNDVNRRYYATDMVAAQLSGPAGIRFELWDERDPNFPSTNGRDYKGVVDVYIDLEPGESYQVVSGNAGSYSSERIWTLFDNNGLVLNTYQNSGGWAPGNVQYTFTT